MIIRDKEKDNKIITFILKNGSKIIITIDKFNKIISSINSRLCNIREHILEQEKLSHEFPEFEEETMDSDWITFSKTWK